MSGSHSAAFGGFVLSVLLHFCISASSKLSIEVIPPRPKVGDTVTLSVHGINGTIIIASWYKGQSTSAIEQILSYVYGKDIRGAQFFQEASSRQNGSLVIRDFQDKFKGEYTVQIQTNVILQDGQVTVNGAVSAAVYPLTILVGLLLYPSVTCL